MDWTLTETDKYCPDAISTSNIIGISSNKSNSLVDCQRHCNTIGARRLTFYPINHCRCCTASSKLIKSRSGGKVYELGGKYI